MTLAWAGHAVGTERSVRPFHLTADALHLLGAGLWLGALVPLLLVLGRILHLHGHLELRLPLFERLPHEIFRELELERVRPGCVNHRKSAHEPNRIIGTHRAACSGRSCI